MFSIDATRLHRLQAEIRALRQMPSNSARLEMLACRLGRKVHDAGARPIWTSSRFSHLPPLAIASSGERNLPGGARHRILDQLEEDVLAWSEMLEREGDRNGTLQ